MRTASARRMDMAPTPDLLLGLVAVPAAGPPPLPSMREVTSAAGATRRPGMAQEARRRETSDEIAILLLPRRARPACSSEPAEAVGRGQHVCSTTGSPSPCAPRMGTLIRLAIDLSWDMLQDLQISRYTPSGVGMDTFKWLSI